MKERHYIFKTNIIKCDFFVKEQPHMVVLDYRFSGIPDAANAENFRRWINTVTKKYRSKEKPCFMRNGPTGQIYQIDG